MKKKLWSFVGILMVALCSLSVHSQATSNRSEVVPEGITVDGVDVAGMTEAEFVEFMDEHVETLASAELSFDYEGVAAYTYTPGDFDLTWTNTEIVDEIFAYGTTGNVLERYKALKDLEHEGADYKVACSLDEELVMEALTEMAASSDMKAKNYHLTRSNGAFQMVNGQSGYAMNIKSSYDTVITYLLENWDGNDATIELVVDVTEPMGSKEELSRVQDVLGTFSTSAVTSDASRIGNVTNGANLINGITLYPGEEFDFDVYCAPYTLGNGYYVGHGYSGGRLVDTVGGGICQVSSTLYNAIIRAELEVTMRYNHSMTVGYVPLAADATLAEASGKNLKFINNLDAPIYIEAYVDSGMQVHTTIYGEEYRASNRTIEFISQTLEVIPPGPDVISVDPGQPIGFVSAHSAYTGYRAQLVKIVKIDGVEKSREVVNTSKYIAVARTATFGIATDDPVKLEHLNAAISTSNIDHTINIMNEVLTWPAPEVIE